MPKMRQLILAFGSLALAGVHFTIIYVFAALACARGFAEVRLFGAGIVPIVGGIATLLALAAVLAVPLVAGSSRRFGQIGRETSGWLMLGCAAVAAVTIVLTSLPLALVPVCD